MTKIGDSFPYSEQSWLSGFHSPYYSDSHRKWKNIIREFVHREIIPNVKKWEENKSIPKELYAKAGKENILAGVIGYKWPKEYVGESPVKNYDAFHTHILIDEVSRCGSGGVIWGFFTGLMIGLPPIMKFGSNYLKEKVVKDCLLGKKIICLCISEPIAASDVAGIRTSAKLIDDNYYLVNGNKKWITNGTFADYYTVAVKTKSDDGHNSLSLLLLEKGMPGLKLKHMKCTGVWSSGTTFIIMDNVKVPKKNLIGKENNGFMMIMHNFNHERWGIVIMANSLSRIACIEAIKYSLKRKTFKKYLINHQIIRTKLSNMLRKIEAISSWTENITYQWNNMTSEESMKSLGDKIALLKVQSTKTLEYCARESLHVFGGSGYVQSGQGEKVERIYRDAQAFSIPAGSEEIMLDYAGRTVEKKARRFLKSKL